MSDTTNLFLRRFISFAIGPGVSALIGIIAVPVTTWLISPEDFGKASMFLMFHMLASLIIYLGLDQAFIREFYVSKNKNSLLIHTVTIPFILSVITSGVSLLLFKQVSFLLYGFESFLPVLITALPLPMMVINRFNLLNIRMEEKGKLYSTIIILEQTIKTFLLVTIVFFYRNFIGVICAYSISIFISAILSFIFVKDFWRISSINDINLMKKLLRYGIPLVPATILGWVLNAMDKIALRAWSNFLEIGIYSAGFKIASVLLLFQAAFTTFWSPTAYRWYETGESIQKFEKVSSIISFFLCFVGAFIILFRKIIILILSPAYYQASFLVPFLIFYPILYTISSTTVVGIAFTRRTSLAIWVSFVAAAANLLTNWLLVPKYGALGASIATAISYMAFFWMRTLLSRAVWEKFKISLHIINLLLLTLITVIASFQDHDFISDYTALGGSIFLLTLLCSFNASIIIYVKKALCYFLKAS